MAFFGTNKKSEEAERDALALQAALSARIAEVTGQYRNDGSAAPLGQGAAAVAMTEEERLSAPVFEFAEPEDDWPAASQNSFSVATADASSTVVPFAPSHTASAGYSAALNLVPVQPALPSVQRNQYAVQPVVPPAPPPRQEAQSPFVITADTHLDDELLKETSKHLRSIGAVNILVAGQTGVGKSTLINSVFGEAFATTAAGRPVTQHAEWFVSDKVPLRILDTRGLEAKDYAVTLNAMRREIENSRAQNDERAQLHMGWVCISSPSSRVQDCEIDIVRLLNKYDIPAIVVLTKDDDDPDFADIVAQIMTDRHANVTSIVRVRALAKGNRPTYGLDELVTATFSALPAAHRAAFAAAQKINRELNRSVAEDYVTAAASAAAAASVIPIPFADVATLAPIQAGMFIGISNAFGLTLERSQIMKLITTLLGCLAVTLAGGWAVGNVLKFIPGPGSVIGAVVNATVAGAVTRTLGKTYIRFLYEFIGTNGRLPSADEIFEILPQFYKAGRRT